MKHFYLHYFALLFAFIANAQYTTIPDANFEAALSAYDDIAADGQVPTNNINTLTFLNVGNNNIASLNGIQDFTALEQLRCNNNDLVTLDLSQNLNLQRLRSYSNPLVNLDLSKNTQLIELRSYACLNLTSLNISNGNNTNIEHLNISSNTNLTCVEVDNQTVADDWNNGISLPVTYSAGSGVVYCVLGANEAYIPDDAFESYLEANSLGNGVANDNRVDKSLIATITLLNIGNLGIADAIGIQEFVSLETLQVNDNSLEVIYLDNLTNLLTFRATRNSLIKLDLSNQVSLETLIVDSNNLVDLLLNSNALKYYQIAGNSLLSIDLSGFPLLERLFCGGNDLTSLDVVSNPELKTIECQNNDIVSFDTTNNPNLFDLLVFNNELTSLNVKNSNNAILTNFRADTNSALMCIEVDDEDAATNGTGSYSSWLKDSGAIYSENCAETLSNVSFNLEDISIYPNPATHIVNIVTTHQIESVKIYDLLGKLLLAKENTNQIIIDKLPSGMYLLKVSSKKGYFLRKIIIE